MNHPLMQQDQKQGLGAESKSGSSNTGTLIVLGLLAAGAYWVYKKRQLCIECRANSRICGLIDKAEGKAKSVMSAIRKKVKR